MTCPAPDGSTRAPRADRRAVRQARRGAVVLLLVAALAMGGAGAAWSWWQVAGPLPGLTASAAVVAPPGGPLGCSAVSNGNGWLAYNASVVLTWGASAAPAGSTRTYAVRVTGSDGSTFDATTGTSTSRTITNDDLDPSATTTYTVKITSVASFGATTWTSTALTGTFKATRKVFLWVPYYEMSCA